MVANCSVYMLHVHVHVVVGPAAMRCDLVVRISSYISSQGAMVPSERAAVAFSASSGAVALLFLKRPVVLAVVLSIKAAVSEVFVVSD